MLRVICWAGACTGLLAILAAATWLAVQPALTQFVESESFREKMDQETSKGMHFTGHYDELNRTGTLVVEAPRFVADNGFKTIVSLDARKIRGAFNPWGILLRRW